MKGLIAIIVAVLVALYALPSTAADINIGTFEDGDMYINYEGDVVAGDQYQLQINLDLIKSKRPDQEEIYLYLDSTGGQTRAAWEIMQYLPDYNVVTVVDHYNKCMSACAMIWSYGTRTITREYATLGYHVSSFREDFLQQKLDEAEEGVFKPLEQIQIHVQNSFSISMDIYVQFPVTDPYRFAYMISTKGYNASVFWIPTVDELKYYFSNYSYDEYRD